MNITQKDLIAAFNSPALAQKLNAFLTMAEIECQRVGRPGVYQAILKRLWELKVDEKLSDSVVLDKLSNSLEEIAR